nr:glycoside hydrolase family 5 protein [Pythium porphyrae]
MRILSHCTALLVGSLATWTWSPRVLGHQFNGTLDSNDFGVVIPEEARVQPASGFINEVADDSARAFTEKTTPTPVPTTPMPTMAPTKKPMKRSNNTYSTSQHQQHIQHAIRAGSVQSQGVNLGGWLVSEHWMNQQSDIWKGMSSEDANSGEQMAFRTTKQEEAVGRFKWHRDNFITESEVAAIANAGFNTIRVPVGYWIVGFDNHDISGQNQWKNYAPGGLEYLDRLIQDWARKYNVAVLISMHAAKGSQNGADHSSPEEKGKSFWSHYPENIASTLESVVFLADRYKNEEAFLGIGLLNEPGGSTSNDVLYKYYEDAYKAIRQDAGNDCILTIAPLLWEQSASHMVDLLPGANNVWVEWHRYFVWGYENAGEEELLGKAMTQFRDDVNAWKKKSDKKMFIGEFSFATAGKFQDQARLKEFGAKQMDVMFNTVNGGWTFWSWRIYGDENGVNPWSLRSLLWNGIFPGLKK